MMRRSVRSWLWRIPVEQEVDEELAFHVEMRTRELIAQGMDPRAARDAAGRRLGDRRRIAQVCVSAGRRRNRAMRLTLWIDEVRLDLRFALRQLRAAPAFSAVAILTLALGIGANSAIFALADAVLLRPLPYPGSDRLVLVEERSRNATGTLRSRIAPWNVEDWRERNRTFEDLAAVYVPPGGGGPALTVADGSPEIVPNQNVTATFFDVLGIRPILGRTFQAADETSGDRYVILGEAFWRARLGADSSIVGRALSFDGRLHTVVGIVPADFQFMRPASMWTLLRRPDDDGRRLRALQVIGRLQPDATPDTARDDLTIIADALAAQFDDTRQDRIVTVEPFRTRLVSAELRRMALLFAAVVGFVLLICCVNVANLLLARSAVRAREIAVRAALGAGRIRIVRQLLIESVALGVLGALAGAAIGAAILAGLVPLLPERLLPAGITLVFDSRVAVFCGVTALVSGLLFGLVPAWQAAGGVPTRSLADDSRTSTGRLGTLRNLFVAGQTAAAVLLLCGAGLLLRTLLAVETFSPGYRAEAASVLTMDVTVYRTATLGGSRFQEEDAWLSFFEAVEQEVGSVPGVAGVAWATTLPVGDTQTGGQPFRFAEDVSVDEDELPSADYQIVSPSYFATVGVPIIAGRVFTSRDSDGSTPVAIVSEAFVRRHLGGRNPLGVRVKVGRFATPGMIEREIVGVAGQVKGQPDETEDLVQLYVPNAQDVWAESYLIVRAAAGPVAPLTPAIRRALARVERGLPVRSIKTLDEVAAEATERYWFRALLVGTFAVLALTLAMIGVFGVLAYAVQQRRREFGVRMALGASSGRVMRMVFGDAARLVAISIAVGVVAAASLGRPLSAFLFRVAPLDPVTYASVAAVVGITAVVAIAAPALRATRVDPLVVLRSD